MAREEILNSTRRWLFRMIGYPRDDKGKLKSPPIKRSNVPPPPATMDAWLRVRGYPEWSISLEIRRRSQEEARRQKAFIPPMPENLIEEHRKRLRHGR